MLPLYCTCITLQIFGICFDPIRTSFRTNHIAYLTQWLEALHRDLLGGQAGLVQAPSLIAYSHALVLRAQCLITIVYLSTVLSPKEAAYDVHDLRFRRIIEDVATVLDQDRSSVPGPGQYCLEPGVLQPLFFTAIKYRHSVLRRKAVELIRKVGREGPWDGKLLAVVAARAVEIEEGCSEFQDLVEILPGDISEQNRLHGCAMDAEDSGLGPKNTVTVMFSQCLDVEHMISGNVSWDDKSNWSIWREDPIV